MLFTKQPHIQSEISECGLAAVAICLDNLGHQVSMAEMRRHSAISSRGASLSQLIDVFCLFNVVARPLKCEIEELNQLKTPAILHWSLSHYVVLTKVKRNSFSILDPAGDSRTYSSREMREKFTGVALELSSTPGFSRRKVPKDFSIWRSIRIKGVTLGPLAQAIAFTAALQLLQMLAPYYGQLVIDNSVSSNDASLAGAFAVVFLLVALFTWVAEILRGFTTQAVSTRIGWDLSTRLFSHMLRLPQSWFDRRRSTDTMLRYDSINPIKQLVSGTFIGSCLDGFLLIVVATIMFYYSSTLSFVALSAVVLVLLLRLFTYRFSLRLSSNQLRADIVEKSTRLEMIKGMQSIKLASAEGSRGSKWANDHYEQTQTAMASATFNSFVGASNNLIVSCCLVVLIYIAATSITSGAITIGGLYAFLAYRQQFTQKAIALFDQAIAWRLTELHSDRVGEIAMEHQEATPRTTIHLFIDRLEFSNLFFRFTDRDPFVVANASGKVGPGEFLAITGPSGCGKSTLLKVLCGLYLPTHGVLLASSVPYAAIGAQRVRGSISAVLQNDELFTGTVAENVTFFSSEPDEARILQAMEIADLTDFVNALPMKIETHIGDMGCALSAGQRQRLMIARAIYRDSAIIVLDEATSNLDEDTEKRVMNRIIATNKTIIAVSHRESITKLATHVVELGGQNHVR